MNKKNLINALSVAALLILISGSCKKKTSNSNATPATGSSTTTAGTTTGNTTTGGTTTGGTTTGGTTTVTYKKVKVTGFSITEMESLAPPLGWDPNDGPDVYYKIFGSDNSTVKVNGFFDLRKDVVASDFPLNFVFTTPYVIDDLDTFFSLSVYDYDGNTEEKIGGLSFRFGQGDDKNYPSTHTETLYKCKVKYNIIWFN